MLFCWYWKTNRTLIFNSGNTKHIQTNTDTYIFHIQNPTIYISRKQEERERDKYFVYIYCVGKTAFQIRPKMHYLAKMDQRLNVKQVVSDISSIFSWCIISNEDALSFQMFVSCQSGVNMIFSAPI